MSSPRDRRLKADYERVLELVAASGTTLRIESANGNPPSSYVIRYRCRGIEQANGERPIYRDEHHVRIDLPVGYPGKEPVAQLLTPMFHPNVWTNNIICLGGRWTPAEYLDKLLLRIGAIIQYDPQYLNLGSAANPSAKAWAQRNMRLFPVGQCTFKTPTDQSAEISWRNLK